MVFSDYHHRLQHDESSSSNNNQATAGPSADDQPAGFCSVLFNLNRDLFNALQLSGRVSDEDTDEGFLAQNEAGRFRLWGDGFAVQDGGLDELLDGSVLQGAVVVQLVSIARKLRRCKSSFTAELWGTTNID